MSDYISFADPDTLAMLDQLDKDAAPEWGMMTAQHMVEHLILAMKMSVGKIKTQVSMSEKEQSVAKAFLLSEKPLPKNFTGIVPADTLIPLKYSDLTTAKEKLKDAIDEFSDYYRTADRVETHPVFGPLKRDEWITFHNKHFTHHFQQFGLTK